MARPRSVMVIGIIMMVHAVVALLSPLYLLFVDLDDPLFRELYDPALRAGWLMAVSTVGMAGFYLARAWRFCAA